MKEKYVKLSDLVPYEKNPRKNAKAVGPTARSMEDYGYVAYITVGTDNVIVMGHTRRLALLQLQKEGKLGKGMLKDTTEDRIKVIDVSDLSEEKQRELRIIDNQTGGLAEWDDDLLQDELANLPGIDAEFFGIDRKESLEIEEDDYEVEVPEDPMSKVGDVYILGDHVLVVGDATSKEDLAKLLQAGGGHLIDMLMTDPPYNVSYEGKTEDALTIDNDSMSDDSFVEFLTSAFDAADSVMKDGAPFYIWHASSTNIQFEKACENVKWPVRQTLIWSKNTFVLGRQDYQWKHEPCLYGWKGGAPHYFTKERNLPTVLEQEPIDIDNMKADDMRQLLKKILESDIPVSVINEKKPVRNGEHPTMKPIKLIARLIINSSKKGERVLDMFGGSGSTMIACEQLGRKCLMMELDPRYADVIVDRWEEFTGRKATLKRDAS